MADLPLGSFKATLVSEYQGQRINNVFYIYPLYPQVGSGTDWQNFIDPGFMGVFATNVYSSYWSGGIKYISCGQVQTQLMRIEELSGLKRLYDASLIDGGAINTAPEEILPSYMCNVFKKLRPNKSVRSGRIACVGVCEKNVNGNTFVTAGSGGITAAALQTATIGLNAPVTFDWGTPTLTEFEYQMGIPRYDRVGQDEKGRLIYEVGAIVPHNGIVHAGISTQNSRKPKR